MSSDDEPKVRYGDGWIPAHEAWQKTEVLHTAIDQIERYNRNRPELATALTKKSVPAMRKRLQEIEVHMPPRPRKTPELAGIAARLLARSPAEEVLKTLAAEHDCETDMSGLLYLVGEERYTQALQREAAELTASYISHEQIAELWNDTQRPAPGGGRWNPEKIAALIDA